jgi:indole-3-glycerol phosphate synthase
VANVLDKIVAAKRIEIAAAKQRLPIGAVREHAESMPPPRDFLSAIHRPHRIGLIAEVKKASPSKGVIREDFNPVSIAQAYEAGGASAISVLTDEQFFQGSLDYLRSVREAVSIPVMRKEFILDPYQIFEARAAGADAVLLIAECLEPSELKDLFELTRSLEMRALIELYDFENLDDVLATNCSIVGVNNRDLRTFEVDLDHTLKIRSRIPRNVCLVAESGIVTHADVQKLAAGGADAMLVGESLMRQPDISLAVRELLGEIER